MAPNVSTPLPAPTAEQRRAAAGQFERAKQVLASENHDYAIQLLLNCCKLDPANLTYRQALRQTEKSKYKNNLRGSKMAVLTTSGARMKIKAARRAGEHVKVLEHGEEVLVANPWDTGAQLDMARAADDLGLTDMAIWFLFQIRETKPDDPAVNRFLAKLCERRGNFKEAILLWEMVRRKLPDDPEAQNKAKDLAASNTIAQGHYEEVVSSPPTEDAAPPPMKTGVRSQKTPLPPTVSAGRERSLTEEEALLVQIKETPTNWDLYLRLSALYRRAGDFDRARTNLEQALAPSGNHFEVKSALADLAIEPLRRDLAQVAHELSSRPSDDDLLQRRGALQADIAGRELPIYREKVKHYPNDNGLRLELGIRLLKAGQVDDAIREFQAVRSDPRQQWRALMYLGHAFKCRQYWRLAEGNFEEALKKLPPKDEDSRKEILLQLAEGAAASGDLHKAIERAYELANLDFDYGGIGKRLDEWQKRVKTGA